MSRAEDLTVGDDECGSLPNHLSNSMLHEGILRPNSYIGPTEVDSTTKVGDRRIFSPFLFHPDLVTGSDTLIIPGSHLVAVEQERGGKLVSSVSYTDASRCSSSKLIPELGVAIVICIEVAIR